MNFSIMMFYNNWFESILNTCKSMQQSLKAACVLEKIKIIGSDILILSFLMLISELGIRMSRERRLVLFELCSHLFVFHCHLKIQECSCYIHIFPEPFFLPFHSQSSFFLNQWSIPAVLTCQSLILSESFLISFSLHRHA